MKNTLKKLALGAMLLAAPAVIPASAQGIFGVPNTPIYQATVAGGSATNFNALIDCTKGKELFISFSYMVATNYANNSTFATTLTNLTAVFQAGDSATVTSGNWGPNGTTASETDVPATWTLTVPGRVIGVTNYALTNITVNALPYVRCRYITNWCGVDANCKATNIMIRYWVK